jgi:hypothetical protein
MNHLDRMSKRLQKHAEKKKKGRPRKVPVIIPPPPPPPPPPKKTVINAVLGSSETLTLLGGANLDVGDVFWQTRKFVIKKIIKTAGVSDVEVEAEVTKRTWSPERPYSI